MKRTKEWWARLTKDERAHLVYLERSDVKGSGRGRSAYLPDDCGECPACGTPTISSGLCHACYQAWKSYINKADGVTES